MMTCVNPQRSEAETLKGISMRMRNSIRMNAPHSSALPLRGDMRKPDRVRGPRKARQGDMKMIGGNMLSIIELLLLNSQVITLV
jgi:hypothetical protein